MMPKLVAVCPTVLCTDTRIIRHTPRCLAAHPFNPLHTLTAHCELDRVKNLGSFRKKLTKPSLNPNHHWPHWGFLRKKSYVFMQQSAIAVCNLPTLFRTPDSTLQRTSFWDYSQMVGSHISEGRGNWISILSESTYQPISLLVSVIFVALCVCARVSLSLLVATYPAAMV
jgi:hypothetical protein